MKPKLREAPCAADARVRDEIGEVEMLREFINLAPLGIIKFAGDGAIGMANAEAVRLLMRVALADAFENVFTLLAPMLPDVRRRVEGFAGASGRVCELVRLSVPVIGDVLELSINKIAPDLFMAVLRDVSQAAAAEGQVRVERHRLKAILDSVHDHAVCTTDLDGRVLEWNASLRRAGGWEAADLAGAHVRIFFGPSASAPGRVAELLAQARDFGAAAQEGWVFRRDGQCYWGQINVTALPGADGAPAGYVVVTRDLSAGQKVAALSMLAETDPLTQLGNRRAGAAALDRHFALWHGQGAAFCVAMGDIDAFKRINDVFGHEAGDEVLMAVARLAQGALRSGDIVLRWGGDELLMLLPNTSMSQARRLVERLWKKVNQAGLTYRGSSMRVTMSFGVAEVRPGQTQPREIVEAADRALYEAKAAGGNQVMAG